MHQSTKTIIAKVILVVVYVSVAGFIIGTLIAYPAGLLPFLIVVGVVGLLSLLIWSAFQLDKR
jgi:hypothetical protein